MQPHHTTNEVPYGYCQCGCGNRTNISKKTDHATQRVKGQPMRFIKGHDKRRPIHVRFWEKVNKTTPEACWEWTACIDTAGYGLIGDGDKHQLAHRLSYELHYGPIPEGMCVCHTCDNRLCVNPAHLWLGTNADNVADKMNKKRRGRSAKLTESQVIEIRNEYARGGVTYQSIADKYGIGMVTVFHIIQRRTWRTVP